MRFADKVMLVTGGSRGIGRAVALALGSRGATVVVHYGHNERAASEVVASIMNGGGRAFAVGADLASLQAPEQLITRVRDGLTAIGVEPALEGLVLNAGELVVGAIGEVTVADFDRALAVNVRAPLLVIQAAIPILRHGARVVTVSAAITRQANPTMLVQSAA